MPTWLRHPLTSGLEVDDPETTSLRRQIIQQKRFLRRIYEEWYALLTSELPARPGPVLELGAGAGFLSEYIPNVITSDVFACADIRAVLDGRRLPFAADSLRAILMTNVLHHIPEARLFFAEALRCLSTDGVVLMIEPWVTPWSNMVSTKFHYEPFDASAEEWDFPTGGPLSSANGALPWIIFQRDRSKFQREFPTWAIKRIQPIMPFRYLVSGGVTMRSFMPGWSFGLWHSFENILSPWMNQLGMFALIVLAKKAPHGS
ncbi:MAG TPA: methyltransferase domain-containing protein [Aggregatilineales bacterium]|nr:methyltransferase domain-containing protein [Aggregatilineales bacterium]